MYLLDEVGLDLNKRGEDLFVGGRGVARMRISCVTSIIGSGAGGELEFGGLVEDILEDGLLWTSRRDRELHEAAE